MWRKLAPVLLCMLLLTGCWDRLELNDRAILLGTGVDLLEDGRYMMTANIVVPLAAGSKGGNGGTPGFLTETAVGKDLTDAKQNMQKKLSRVAFSGHRRNIFIGESLARHGLSHLMDQYARSPDVRPRSNIYVVKGGTAQQAMSLFYKLETNPSIAVQKIQEKVGAPISRSLLDFFILINKDNCGVMPSLKLVDPEVEPVKKTDNDSPPQPTLEIEGIGIFNEELKLVGYMEMDDFWVRLWVTNRLKHRDQTESIGGKEDTVSIRLTHLKSKVTPEFNEDGVSFNILLKAKGEVIENNTALALADEQAVKDLEQQFEKILQSRAEQSIKKIQTGYGLDIFGLGDSIRMFHPYKWRRLEPNWENTFKKAEIKVRVDLNVRGTGLDLDSLVPERSREDSQ
ncbi:Ger(x)C family spore germination protein [Paenibacillus pinistramenti]|uniref:Ger(x)C family spore germination protein n=1 Tax=Paenibacillus pinistramenti TaxID=1768003 RepID=UPI001107B19D|nr:Ger(x)C family spore germination protein [Paenibacillus pinistramenti]